MQRQCNDTDTVVKSYEIGVQKIL